MPEKEKEKEPDAVQNVIEKIRASRISSRTSNSVMRKVEEIDEDDFFDAVGD